MTSIGFDTLGVPFPLLEVLAREGIASPFPIQAATLPDTLAGRDVLGRGRTGSGKTLAFALPLVARLGARTTPGARRPGRPLGLVLAPTRELATQIAATIAPLADAYGLRCTTIFGGVSQQRQVDALRAGVDIVVACPGRLEDLMRQGHVRLDSVEVTVLDEADHMSDLGFLPVVTRLLAATPPTGQRMLFSATLDGAVDRIVKRFLANPVHHGADAPDIPAEEMEHHVLEVADPATKKRVVQTLASGRGRRILFTRTKHTAKRWARELTAAGIPSVDLHGNLSQNQRDRNLARFASGDSLVLVATDVAARGVHVDDVDLVVHVDPPAEHKAYLHRSGRTARGGGSGVVVTVVLPEERRDLAGLLRKAKIAVAPRPTAADSPELDRLVGERAPFVEPDAVQAPAPRAQPARNSAPRNSQRTSTQRTQGTRAQEARTQGTRAQGTRAQGSRTQGSGRPAQRLSDGSASATPRSRARRSRRAR